LYWYGLGTDPLSESDASGNLTNEYIFLNGARIAMLQLSSSTVNYYVADHLGSSRVVTNASGTVLDDSDFYPFGGERSYASGSGNNYKFTGKERDTESGLDDFAARFYTSNYGRFLSADDAKYMHPADPQTFNLYSYVANNPLNAVDPTGHDPNRAMRYMRTVDEGENVGLNETTQAEEENNDVVGDTIADVQQHELAVEAAAQAAGQQQQQQQQLQNQSASSSSDKRTDIMLSDNNVPPKPALKEGAQFEMDYKIVPQADTMQQLQDNSISLRDDSATQAKYSKMKVSLWESQRGEKWQWEGEPITGHGHDILNVFAQNADQRWYVDGKRVQMVIGKDSAGNLIKAWTVHVEVKPTGPVLTKVD
jgi:RHS repeat-associated protein